MNAVFITGADRGLGYALCASYLADGFTVFAGKYLCDYSLLERLGERYTERLHIVPLDVGNPESVVAAYAYTAERVGGLDMLISNAALMGRVNCSLLDPPMDIEAAWRSFSVNALGALRLAAAFMPLLSAGQTRRLCFVSSEVASVTLMKHSRSDGFPYPMSKASLNMAVRLLFCKYYPLGYTFRLFHPGWMKRMLPDGSLSEEAEYDPTDIAATARNYFDNDLGDEHRLIMLDYRGREWPY
ncbi:MAG: SDR family NAD(P)-dependent oxidoreductase [Oscillospiraceae bacterium]|jgi:NAD(P)-dependent dehydrogenase (short-subunit alcohol dehydrogenase family)|nr:SDR family NAD(P)-dependent oxidoreductase [Oscillospiraceae bacterium]